MAHIRLGEAQQNGAFNNGAVGQQFTPLCQWPYVWDRVRKACVLPDEWDWAYEGVLPWGWGARWADDRAMFGYEDPAMGRGGALEGLGASCPEGSGRTSAYTGPLVPGTDCRCSPGRVVHNGYCQSPQSVVQQSSAKLSDYAKMTVEQQMAQPLSEYAKKYIQQSGHSVSCKLVYPSTVPGGPNYPTNMCSIDNGPYIHGTYAINLNPETAVVSAARETATAQAIAQGVPRSAVGTPEAQKAITAAIIGASQGGPVLVTDTTEAKQGAQLRDQLRQSLVRGMDIERTDGRISWRAEIAFNANSSLEMVQEALKVPPGFFVGQGVVSSDGRNVTAVEDSGYFGTGIGTGAGGADGGFDVGSIPWWAWVAVAGGAYMVMKKK